MNGKLRKDARRAMSNSSNFVCLTLSNSGEVSLYCDTQGLNPNDMRHDMLLKTEQFIDGAGEIMMNAVKKRLEEDLPGQAA